MAKKISTKPVVEAVRGADGAFIKFNTFPPVDRFTTWETTAMSYLDSRRLYGQPGYVPGFIRNGEQAILGFKDPQGRFVS